MTGTLLSFDDVLGITFEVWGSYLGAGEELGPRVPDVEEPIDAVSSSVSVAGGWAGHVVVSTTWPAAREIAATMLSAPAAQLSDADVCDALGEVANVVGGNVKSVVPGPSTLSLPVVARGASLVWPDAEEVVRAELAWRGEPVTVSVWSARGSENAVPSPPRRNA